MKKELPGLFANKINKPLNNNEKVAVTKNEEREVVEERKPISSEKNVLEKIKEIFDSPRYVYKADVKITLKDKTITKKIVGKTQTHLLTLENELIPIQDIVDIKFNEPK